MENVRKQREAAREELQTVARKVLQWARRDSQQDTPSAEQFWQDVKRVLRQLRFTSEAGAFARGNFLSAYVGIAESPSVLFNACLTLYPYDQRWSTVRGVEITLAGKGKDHRPLPARTLRTGWEGGITFSDLPAGEYQVLLTADCAVATWQAAQELILHHLRCIGGEEVQQASNALVTVRVEKRDRSGEVELELSFSPHIATVDMSGFPVVLVGVGCRGGFPLRSGQIDPHGQVVFQHLYPGEYWFAHPDRLWAPSEDIPFRPATVPHPARLAAANVRPLRGREARLRFPAELDRKSPLVCTLDETATGEYLLGAHLRVPLEGTPRLLYALVEEPSEKIATVTREQAQVELRGEIPLEQLPEGEWIGQVSLGCHLAEALGVAPEGPHYRLRAFVVGGQALRPSLPPTRVELPALGSLAAAAAGTQEQTLVLPMSRWSEDGSILCTLYRNAQGQVVIEFRSEAAHLQGGRVRFIATSQHTKEELLHEFVTLKPDAEGILTGRCILSDTLDLLQGYALTFEPVPPLR